MLFDKALEHKKKVVTDRYGEEAWHACLKDCMLEYIQLHLAGYNKAINGKISLEDGRLHEGLLDLATAELEKLRQELGPVRYGALKPFEEYTK